MSWARGTTICQDAIVVSLIEEFHDWNTVLCHLSIPVCLAALYKMRNVQGLQPEDSNDIFT
jgi:hypothetical protein